MKWHYYYPDLTDEDTRAQSKQLSQHHIHYMAEPGSSEHQSHSLIHRPQGIWLSTAALHPA